MVSFSPVVVLGAWAAAVAAYDIRFRRVPNWLVVIGLLCACAQYAGRLQVLALPVDASLLGGLIAFVVFLPLYVFRAMGAADVKVFTVLGLWLGVGSLLPIWVIASAAAAAHALYAVVWPRVREVVVIGRFATLGGVPERPVRGAPYAGFLTIAACAVALYRLYPAGLLGSGG
jgi:prepilin peptidase CpaA